MEVVGQRSGKPSRRVIITDCGQLPSKLQAALRVKAEKEEVAKLRADPNAINPDQESLSRLKALQAQAQAQAQQGTKKRPVAVAGSLGAVAAQLGFLGEAGGKEGKKARRGKGKGKAAAEGEAAAVHYVALSRLTSPEGGYLASPDNLTSDKIKVDPAVAAEMARLRSQARVCLSVQPLYPAPPGTHTDVTLNVCGLASKLDDVQRDPYGAGRRSGLWSCRTVPALMPSPSGAVC
ncbi:hypothetical protein HYH03_005757 [Edaphochlamys debaryana]|uniref:Uncharacterized protein n=1 Tax=Edaphochlamys debaryana TaxID=47281 RepID=A0A835Y4V6_9CHLO|nr:hypothetical protein HYH03_005757 [Edaphochlamys debaryana]|eukprot:KAG2496155.1 hypothetical protein HYH03_005757 [Edaphochlamys debaryana]